MMRLRYFLTPLLFFAACTSDTNEHAVTGKDTVSDTVNGNIVIHSDSSDTTHNKVDHSYDCSILKRRIPDEKNEVQIQNDLADLSHCGVDSFDQLYVVPNLFPGYVSENHVQGNFNITYADFLKHVSDFKSTPAYAQLHQRVNTLDSLRSTTFDSRKVYMMKPVLGRLGFTEPEWEMFSGFANTYPVPKNKTFTWGDMLNEFEKYSSKLPK